MVIALTRLVGRFLYGVGPVDGWAIAVAAGVLVVVALGAAAAPARRAAGVNPITALCQE